MGTPRHGKQKSSGHRGWMITALILLLVLSLGCAALAVGIDQPHHMGGVARDRTDRGADRGSHPGEHDRTVQAAVHLYHRGGIGGSL